MIGFENGFRYLTKALILGVILAAGMGGAAWALTLPTGGDCDPQCTQQCINEECSIHITHGYEMKLPCETACEQKCQDQCNPPIIEPDKPIMPTVE